MTINMVATQELLGPRSRDGGICRLRDLQTRFFLKPKGGSRVHAGKDFFSKSC